MANAQSPQMVRKRARVRASLVRAARDLIAEKGIDGFRISDITDRGEIGLGTFYSHFDSRDAIIEEVVEATVMPLAENVLAASRAMTDPAEAVSAGVRLIVGLWDADPDLAQLLVNLDRAELRLEGMVWAQAWAILMDGIDQGRFDIPDPELSLRMAIGSVFVVVRALTDGAEHRDASINAAVAVLRSIGLDTQSAQDVARRPLPGRLRI